MAQSRLHSIALWGRFSFRDVGRVCIGDSPAIKPARGVSRVAAIGSIYTEGGKLCG
jgi:hypothetical protein